MDIVRRDDGSMDLMGVSRVDAGLMCDCLKFFKQYAIAIQRANSNMIRVADEPPNAIDQLMTVISQSCSYKNMYDDLDRLIDGLDEATSGGITIQLGKKEK